MRLQSCTGERDENTGVNQKKRESVGYVVASVENSRQGVE